LALPTFTKIKLLADVDEIALQTVDVFQVGDGRAVEPGNAIEGFFGPDSVSHSRWQRGLSDDWREGVCQDKAEE
jgi:hypothetical protein